MTTNSRNESVRYATLPFMGGVDMLRATFVTQTFTKHFHEDYAVGCIEKGAMGFRYRGGGLVAPEGHVNLVVPGEAHDGHAATEQGWTYRMFYLKPEALLEAAGELSSRPTQPNFKEGVLNDPELARCIRSTHAILLDPQVSSLEKETRLYWMLVAWISRHADEPGTSVPAPKHHRAASLARDFIRANYSRDLTLGRLADMAALSPFHMIRVFHREFGLTPHAYLNQVRLQLAKDMLAGNSPIAEVAVDTGFADQSHLTRLFKCKYGLTPARYRNFIQDG